MSLSRLRILTCTFALAAACLSHAQDLAPRAYLITPVHSNAVVLTYSLFTGNLDFQGAVPITDATARASVPILSVYHSMRLFGRSANFTAALPYGVATFRGSVMGSETNVHRSGLLDSSYRFSINLIGGPAMEVRDFQKWRQKTIVGVSLRVVAPTGQYDSTKLINFGNHRWAFKPEIGLSRRWSHWVLDAYTGAWFYTSNPKFFSQNQYNPGIIAQTQTPIIALESHLSYDVRARLWASLDGNFYFGGRTSLNGVENPITEQRSSRLGGTVSIPVGKHVSLKCSYSNGAYIKYGGDFQNFSIGWQYSWLGRPN